MNLQFRLKNDLIAFLKSQKTFETGVLRLLSAALHNREIEKRGSGQNSELTEEEVIDVLKKEAKKRREANDLFLKGGRRDLADKEEQELILIQKYLPAEMPQKQLEDLIDSVMKKNKPVGVKDMGRLMAELEKSADSQSINRSQAAQIIKRKIESKGE